ncbi:MAG: HIT domain-containing protein [Malacoplasma sp.]|nr:HIT domain-containing protein [Malacoplasma sp.]
MEKNNNLDCLFCKIVNKTIPCNLIAESENAIAFLDINPVSDGHTLIIPKTHCTNLVDASESQLFEVMKLVPIVTKKIAQVFSPAGFNFLSNMNAVAGQAVFHFHIHIMPKYEKDTGFVFSGVQKNLRPIDEVFNLLKKN